MGACVSSHHKASAMKVHISSGSDRTPNNNVVIPLSPIKEKLPIIDGNVPVKPQLPPLQSTDESIDFGSKEETFFDSQAWLESDCESDFMSVNGEFTPSRGNTPVHGNFAATTPPIRGGAPAIDGYKLSMTVSQPFTSPIKKHKRLSELFSESPLVKLNCEEEIGELANVNRMMGDLESVAVHGSGLKPKRERWVGIVRVHGCLPRVLSSRRSVTHQQTEVRTK
ncbi:hypothetical protein M8C21_014705 [Ambrosia artemisiifolia]|uniref:Uncharacterized protein n=1 Tax=Ambrosia artemisiifolia TaxID=4212 RepID=A0AAD5D0A1_AMBAR|nr:hypothetical protein M8C21_014705 [Ambrosia artemisiifolia]